MHPVPPRLRALSAAALLLAPVACAAAGENDAALPQGSPVAETQSFEAADVPAFARAEKGRLSLSDRRAVEGRQSLRWDWLPGDRLTFTTGPLGKLDVRTGYGGYSRSAFAIRLRPEAVQEGGALTFRWMAGERAAAHFVFPLVFDGWQAVCYHYAETSSAKLPVDDRKALQAADRIVIEAPATGQGGTLYFDAVDLNRPVDYRGGRHPVKERWKPRAIADCGDAAITAPATPAELESAATLTAALRAPGKTKLSEAQAVALREGLVKKYDLERHEDGLVTGRTLPGFSGQITGDMLNVANAWLGARAGTDPGVLAHIEETYFLLDDFFRECGAVAQGSMEGMNWYGGRSHAAACFLMAEPLRRTGRLARVRDCLKFFWGYDGLLFELPAKRRPMGMDYFRNDIRPLLYTALMHDDPQEVVSHLRAYARRIDIDLLNSIEADGSLYHHGMHYYAYANGAVAQMADAMRLLGPTPFALSRATYEKLRMAVMNMRFYANLLDLPLPMHGRHPGRQGLVVPAFPLLAQASAVYNGGKMDPELAAAYLRLKPDDAANLALGGGFSPEPHPQGNLSMNYAGLIGHRRDGWLVQARGYGKYFNAFESYAACNRRGLFMGNGCLSILGSGNPVNLVDSGCDTANGWDWRHLDGCTTYEAPLEVIANGNGTLGDVSDVGFVGGLSHRGTNGVFVMPLHSKRQYAKGLPKGAKDDGKKAFAANKSYFFFDRRIVCLGSGISLPDVPYPVQTTLFQNALPGGATRPAIQVDGTAVVELPYRAALDPGRPHTLMDVQGNGYYLPAGQSVTVTRQHQESFAGCDDKPTEGDAATALVEHGVNPTDGSYAYFVLPKSTPEALGAFAEAMAKGQGADPVVVARRDARAHVVYDRAAATWGCVFFEGQQVAPIPGTPAVPVAAVTGPCLVMAEQAGDGTLFVSVCDPDLHRVENESVPSQVTVTLHGRWGVAGKPEQVAVRTAGDQTQLTFTCQDGKTYLAELRR